MCCPALLAVAVHETGHILAAKLCGMQIKSVTFGALGIHMAGETASVGDFRRAVVSLAGPFANLLSFLLLCRCRVPILPCSSRCSRSTCCPPYRWTAAPRFTVCCAAPFSEKTAERTITVSSVLLALTLGTLGFSVLISTGYNFTLLFLAVYILFYLILKQRGNMC